MRSFIEKSDMTVECNYEKACEMIDMESFINYYAAEIYMASSKQKGMHIATVAASAPRMPRSL